MAPRKKKAVCASKSPTKSQIQHEELKFQKTTTRKPNTSQINTGPSAILANRKGKSNARSVNSFAMPEFH